MNTPAMGPFHGMSEMESAMDVPIMPAISGLQSWSTLITVITTETSFRMSLGNSGRMGRSTTRLVSTAFSPGRTLAAHEAAGDAAHGIQLFFKVHRKGEEIDAVAGLVAHGDVAQHSGLAVAHQAAAVGKAAHLARLHNERAACQLGFKTLCT